MTEKLCRARGVKKGDDEGRSKGGKEGKGVSRGCWKMRMEKKR